jgi:hypothetical protein
MRIDGQGPREERAMFIELTAQQSELLQQRRGQPLELVDPRTQQAYVLIAREQYEQSQQELASERRQPEATKIPEGIRLSREALHRDLPALLNEKKLRGQWVAYHGAERIGIAPREAVLLQECVRRGLRDDEYYVGWIDASEMHVEEEVDTRPQHFAEQPDTSYSHSHDQGS